MESRLTGRLILLCIVLSFVLSGCSVGNRVPDKKERQITEVSLPKESKAGMVEFKLYFGSQDLKSIKPEERSVKRDELLGYALLYELIKGPAIKSELKPLLPQDTRVLSFSIRDDVGYANLDGAVLKNISLSPEQEKSIVEGIVNTLCQLPGINRVQLMFDNEKKDTLAGSVDISKPLSPGDLK